MALVMFFLTPKNSSSFWRCGVRFQHELGSIQVGNEAPCFLLVQERLLLLPKQLATRVFQLQGVF